jgi:hypothetical protein
MSDIMIVHIMMWIIIDRPMIDGQSIAINDIEYRGWLIFIGGGDYVESVVPGGASQATLPAKTLPAKTVSTWLSTEFYIAFHLGQISGIYLDFALLDLENSPTLCGVELLSSLPSLDSDTVV